MQTRRLIGKMPTIAAFAYRHSRGLPYVYPDNELSYTGNFLSMLFKMTELKLQAEPGARARARRALHPARRPRAELLDQRRARRRQLAGRSVLGGRGGGGRALRPAARRRQRGGHPHADGDRLDRQRPRTRSRSSRRARGASWASATASTRTTIRARRSSSEIADEVFEVTGKNPLIDIALELERIALAGRLLRQAQALSERRFLLGHHLPGDGLPDDDVPGAVRHSAHVGLAGAVGGDGARRGAEDRPAAAALHRRGERHWPPMEQRPEPASREDAVTEQI